jgi:O-antigen ligase
LTWASSPGDALTGSNRALLYFLLFALFAVLPWTPRRALVALLTFTVAVGAVGAVLLVRLAAGDHIASLFVDGRLNSPTGYFNASPALFTIVALVATALAARRDLPAIARGALVAVACGSLQLAVLGQSRGWLFTLPIVAIAGIAVVADRIRVAAAAGVVMAGTLAPLASLLGVFRSLEGSSHESFLHAAEHAGRIGLLACGIVFVAGTLLAWGERRVGVSLLSPNRARVLGTVLAVLALGCAVVGGVAATHGHPFRVIARQWHGFTHQSSGAPGRSHFGQVGSGRYDFWRVSWHAALAHPLGGLGQDNFADYYIRRRRTGEEPRWTHSMELRLLTHTGFVGLGLFLAFLTAAVAAAVRGRRRAGAASRAVAGAALLPLVVWLIHGSVDWFWEMPALTGPAFAFLGLAGALSADRQALTRPGGSRPVARRARIALVPTGVLAVIAAVVALGFPYLSVRQVSRAGDEAASDPAAALRHLHSASGLNPWSAAPGRLAGAIALQQGLFLEAERRFRQAVVREPGGWFAWLGDGLAASMLGDRARARRDYSVAAAINNRLPVIADALGRVDGPRPLAAAEALGQLAKIA